MKKAPTFWHWPSGCNTLAHTTHGMMAIVNKHYTVGGGAADYTETSSSAN